MHDVLDHGWSALVALADPAERQALADDLAADGAAVIPAGSGREALDHLATARPDVALVDLDLPGAGGLHLLERVRAGGPGDPWDPAMPLLALGRGRQPHHAVRAFDRGADDFLARPAFYPELLARMRLQVRRARGAAPGTGLRVGPVAIDRRARTVTVAGRVVALSAKELGLLAALAAEPRRVLTKQELLRDVWGYRSPGRTRTVDSHASRLRRKLAQHAPGAGLVVNVWGVGYRLLPGDA